MHFIACGIIPLILYYFYVKRAVSDHQAPVESADFFFLYLFLLGIVLNSEDL